MTPSFQLAQSQLPDNGWMRARPLVGGCLPVHGATNTTRLINWASEKDGVLLARFLRFLILSRMGFAHRQSELGYAQSGTQAGKRASLGIRATDNYHEKLSVSAEFK